MDGRMISNLKHCMMNSYFPCKKVALFCCLFLMQGIKPRVLHTVRMFNKMSGKNLRRFYHVKQQEGEIILTFARKPSKGCTHYALQKQSWYLFLSGGTFTKLLWDVLDRHSLI